MAATRYEAWLEKLSSSFFVLHIRIYDQADIPAPARGDIIIRKSGGDVYIATPFTADKGISNPGYNTSKWTDDVYTVQLVVEGFPALDVGRVTVKRGIIESIETLGEGSTGEQPPPVPAPGSEGPQLSECAFPDILQSGIYFIVDLAKWIGCMIRNIIAILKWVIDWLLHFSDHLDIWISNLFGIDPALPFFDELWKKIDEKVSTRLGVDPEKPLLDELVKKAIEWLLSSLDAAAEQEKKDRGY